MRSRWVIRKKSKWIWRQVGQALAEIAKAGRDLKEPWVSDLLLYITYILHGWIPSDEPSAATVIGGDLWKHDRSWKTAKEELEKILGVIWSPRRPKSSLMQNLSTRKQLYPNPGIISFQPFLSLITKNKNNLFSCNRWYRERKEGGNIVLKRHSQLVVSGHSHCFLAPDYRPSWVIQAWRGFLGLGACSTKTVTVPDKLGPVGHPQL